MSEIQGAWVPETPEEETLLLSLHEATRDAYNDGVAIEDIVAGMNYLSAAIALYGDDSGFVKAAEDAAEETDTRRETCPECDADIDDVQFHMGGEAFVRPCGCNVTVHQVPGWVDIGGDQ